MRLISLAIAILPLCLHVGAARVASAPLGQAPRDLVRAYLQDNQGFTPIELEAVNAGRAVAKAMATSEPQDVSIFGAVRIAGPPSLLIQQLKNIEGFESRLGVLAVGRFRNPPRLDDLGALTLDAGDLAGLPSCQPRACSVQLPADAMARFRTAVNWQAPDAPDQANRLFRQMLFDLLATYHTGGNAALGVYEDRNAPTRIAAEFAMLVSSVDVPMAAPGLARYLVDYPKATLRGAEDFFYWDKAGFGLKPTIRLSHATVYPVVDPQLRRDGLRFVVATKQLYSSHYFSTTLELRSLIDDAERPGKGFFLLYATRSRVAGLTGVLGGIIRTTVKSRARTAMERHLEDTKRVIESLGGRAG